MKRPIDYLIKGLPSNEELKTKLGISSFEKTSGGRYKTAGGAIAYGAKKAYEKVKGVTNKVIESNKRYAVEKKARIEKQESDTLRLADETKHLDLSDRDYRDPVFRAKAEAEIIKKKKRY